MFSIKDIFSKYEKSRTKLRIWSQLLKKFLKENFILWALGTLSQSNKLNKQLGSVGITCIKLYEVIKCVYLPCHIHVQVNLHFKVTWTSTNFLNEVTKFLKLEESRTGLEHTTSCYISKNSAILSKIIEHCF